MTTPEKKNEQRTFHTFIASLYNIEYPHLISRSKRVPPFQLKVWICISPPPSYVNICMGAPPFTIWILPQKNAYTKYTEML